MLEFDNVSKSFWTGSQRKVILDRVSFRVELGRSLGILAPNGTGKTTLINMMAGLEKPDEGEIRRGCRISFPLGFMGGVVSKHSAVENSRYIARLYGLDPDYVEAYCRWLCGLGEYFDQPLGTYSSGMRARLAFAISMIIEFDCFLIDEIGAVGDARFHDRCNYELFEKRADRAMIIISHDAAYVRDHCNRWGVLHDGKLAQYDDFELAYADFKELIGWKPPPGWLELQVSTA